MTSASEDSTAGVTAVALAAMRDALAQDKPPYLATDGARLTSEDLARFYKARKGDLDAAIAMVRDSMVWRRRHGVDDVLAGPFPDYDVIQTINPHIYGLRDKEGHPLYIERMGGVDSGSVCKIMNEDFSIMRYIHHQEEVMHLCREATRAQGRPVSAACGLIDVKGIRSPSFSLFRVCSEMDQANYPETLHRFYVVNTPWVFQGIYKIAERFLDPVVKSKIRVLGSDLSPLLEDIDASQLPVEYGGTYTGPYGPMYSQSDAELRARLGFTTVTVSAGETKTLEHTTTGEGYLCWTWHTEAHNIGLSTAFFPAAGSPSSAPRPSAAPATPATPPHPPSGPGAAVSGGAGAVAASFGAGTSDAVSPTRGLSSPFAAMPKGSSEPADRGKGVYKPSGPGTLRFTLSNAHSVFRGKTVHIRILDNVGEVEARIRYQSPYTTSKVYGAAAEDVEEEAPGAP